MTYRDYDLDVEITDVDKECAYSDITVVFIDLQTGDDLFSFHIECDPNSHLVKNNFDFQIYKKLFNGDDFNDNINQWLYDNNIKCEFEYYDEYTYDQYEYPIGFENLVHVEEFEIKMKREHFIAFKMLWI